MWMYNHPFLVHQSIYDKNGESCKLMFDGPSQTTSLRAKLDPDRALVSILDTQNLLEQDVRKFTIQNIKM